MTNYYAIGYVDNTTEKSVPMHLAKPRYVSISDALDSLTDVFPCNEVIRENESARLLFEDGSYYLIFREA